MLLEILVCVFFKKYLTFDSIGEIDNYIILTIGSAISVMKVGYRLNVEELERTEKVGIKNSKLLSRTNKLNDGERKKLSSDRVKIYLNIFHKMIIFIFSSKVIITV